MSEIETDDKARLRKLAEAASLGDVRLYRLDGAVVIDYRAQGARRRRCISEGLTLEQAIDRMEFET